MIEKLKYDTHEEWLNLRHQYIGGSDAGAVVGMNPYKSRYALWAEKTDLVAGFEGNLTTQVGAYLEEFVASFFEEQTGKKVQRVNSSYHNTDYPFAIANIDRKVVGENALLEIKTTNSLPIMRQLCKAEFPEAYYCQVTHYLAVTGYEKAYLAVLVNCRDFKVYELERDQAEIDALMQAEKDFWQLVETKTPPPVDGMDSTTDTLKTLYPESTAREVDLMAYETELREYMGYDEQIKQLSKLKEEKANRIKEFMQDAEAGRCGGFKVNYKSSNRSSFDNKKFASDHKDMDLSAYYKDTPVRTFKVSFKEEI